MNMKRFFLYFIVIAALALAGCGGGGGGVTTGPVDPPPPPSPTPDETALKEAQDAAMAAYTAAMAAVGGAVDPVAMQNAQMYADMAKEASDSAQAATTSAMAEEYQTAAETASANAMEAAGEPGLGLIMLANKLVNGDDIKNAELDGPPTLVPDRITNAKNVNTAIATAGEAAFDGGFTNQGGTSGATTVNTISADGSTVVVEHKAGGSKFTLQVGSDTLLTGEKDSRFQTKGDWEAQDLLFQGTNTQTHLVVSTDIQATKTEQKYTTTGATVVSDFSSVLNTAEVTGDVPGDGTTFEGTYNASPTDNTSPLSGRFFCATPGSCSISVNDKGVLTALGGYVFQPTDTGTTSTVDSDYLAWGMWVTGSTRKTLVGTTNDNTPDEAHAGAFAYGNDSFTVPIALEGKATYNGVATGLYSTGGMVQYFDADAMLEADFGGGSGTTFGRISGSISNIMAAGQAVDGSLKLERGTILEAGTFTGTTDGVLGGNGFRGNYGGTLYGPAAKTTNDTATTFPTTAAGTFSAATQDDKMSLIGAFGSWRAE